MQPNVVPLILFLVCLTGLAALLVLLGTVVSPRRGSPVKRMPYESGMDPIHDTRRRFDVRFHLLAIAFLVFDVELLFLYPWAVCFRSGGSEAASAAAGQAGNAAAAGGASARPPLLFVGGICFIVLLLVGFVYDWRKGIFRWR